ncbi:hypothetical protein ACH3Y9_28895 [Streptomyces sp. WSLK1-5]|uniref:hypothetical protein n=1 Tax=unclassified Streptomyces TaxID=2593676 RepID=UPI000F64B9ED|nr:hypothetical protein [Streptomyces sp. RP5T]RRR77758.1 hypothetical protein EHS43_27650 [Streptomyces sp. RP5T]
MRLRRIAWGGAVLGLVGVIVRAEGRAVGRVLLGLAGDSAIAASGRIEAAGLANAYDSASERDLTVDSGWTPTLHTKIDSAGRMP